MDEKNNELLSKKRKLLDAFEAAVIDETNLIRDLEVAEKKAAELKGEVERAGCRSSCARTLYEQASMEYTSYKEDRARSEERTRCTGKE